MFEDAYASKQSTYQPLSTRMRPQTLDEMLGQDHLLGEGCVFRKFVEDDDIPSLTQLVPVVAVSVALNVSCSPVNRLSCLS